MVEDEELEQIIVERQKEKREVVEVAAQEESAVVYNNCPPSDFSNSMDRVKESVLVDASANDEKFVKTIKDNVKDAAVKYTEVEQEKAKLSKQTVQFEQEKLATEQQGNENRALENKWDNKQKQREFHYNGVKPVMKFVDINEPLNLILLYTLTVILLPLYLIKKILTGTVGALIAGASDSDRPKAVKGFLWTLIGVGALCVLAICIYLFLKKENIIQI